SALAASYLARKNSQTLLVVGTGRLCRHLAASHAAVRPIQRLLIWGRDFAKAEAIQKDLAAGFSEVRAVIELSEAFRLPDIVSCATLSCTPLLHGEWLPPGVHLDLVGGFTPAMREADDEAVRRATVFIGTPGALTEAGDIVSPLAS